MKSWKLFPKDESVSKYVECYWFLEKEPHDQSNIYPKLNPHPSCHLIIASSTSTNQYVHQAISQVVKGSHWIFPHIKTFTMDHSSPFKIIGIKFRIGALYSINLHELASSINKIESFNIAQFGWKSLKTEQLLNSASLENGEVCEQLDETLSAWLKNSLDDKHSELARQVLPLLCNTAIAEIGERLHRSQRTVERSFLKVTGFTMKQVHSMIRLEEILSYLYQLDESDINWAEVASQYDFSDQPHLIRHLKNSIGSTPAAYTQQRDLTIDIYGNFEFN